jgi:hypothetical protein
MVIVSPWHPAAPQQHRTIDWVLLLLLCRNHGPQQKAAEALLQKKLQEGQAGLAWVTKAITGHQVRVLVVCAG